jgi:hypothetical protein
MAKPIHIVCCETGSEDRITGQITLVNLIDKFQIQKLPPNTFIAVRFSFWVTALWEREPDDENKEFEYEAILHLPPDDKAINAGSGRFVFNRRDARLTARFNGPIPFQGPGIMRAIIRIRASDGGEWISQEQRLSIEEIEPSVLPANQEPAAPPRE